MAQKTLTPNKAMNALSRAKAQGRRASGKPLAKYNGGPVSSKPTPKNAYRPPNEPRGSFGSKAGGKSGKGSSGSSGKGSSGSSSGSQSPTITKTVTTPAAPFLTGAQQLKLNNTLANYAQKIQNLSNSVPAQTQKTNTALQAAKLAHDNAANQANQLAAARGVFQSSIHDNDLNDIDAAMTEHQNMLNSALKAFTSQVNAQIGMINNTYIPNTIQGYNTMAAQNASTVQPSTSTQTVPNPNYKPPSASTGGSKSSSKGSAGKGGGIRIPHVPPVPNPTRPSGMVPGGYQPKPNAYRPPNEPRGLGARPSRPGAYRPPNMPRSSYGVRIP